MEKFSKRKRDRLCSVSVCVYSVHYIFIHWKLPLYPFLCNMYGIVRDTQNVGRTRQDKCMTQKKRLHQWQQHTRTHAKTSTTHDTSTSQVTRNTCDYYYIGMLFPAAPFVRRTKIGQLSYCNEIWVRRNERAAASRELCAFYLWMFAHHTYTLPKWCTYIRSIVRIKAPQMASIANVKKEKKAVSQFPKYVYTNMTQICMWDASKSHLAD